MNWNDAKKILCEDFAKGIPMEWKMRGDQERRMFRITIEEEEDEGGGEEEAVQEVLVCCLIYG